MKKITQVLLALIVSLSAYSQVTVNTTALIYAVNSGQTPQTVYSCGNVELASSSNVSVSIDVHLVKPHAQAVGTSDLYAYTKRTSSDFAMQRAMQVIVAANWIPYTTGNDQNTAQLIFTLSAADFNASGGTLYVVFKTESGIESQTACDFTITNTPTPSFTLSPTSVSLPCGNTSARSFAVSPYNIPSGATVTYQWNYSGWSGVVNSSMNAVTLVPNSGTFLPSTVSVTPMINGVAKPTLYSTVSRAAFSSTATLNGNTVICPGGTSDYTISGLGTGNTVTWSSSNTAFATVSGGTQSQVTVNALTNGNVDLIATITNPCGQATTKVKTINIGAPVVASGPVYGSLWVRKNYGGVTLSFPAVLGASTYTWTITPGGDFPPTCPTTGTVNPAKFSNGSQTMTTTTPSVTALFGNCLGEYEVTCVIGNACGSTDAYVRYVTVGNTGTSPCATNTAPVFSLMQNPVKNGELKIKVNKSFVVEDPETSGTPAPSIVEGDGPCFQDWPMPAPEFSVNGSVKGANPGARMEVKVYDFYGNQVYTKTIDQTEEEMLLNDVNLNTGKYILHISDGLNVQREIVVIE